MSGVEPHLEEFRGLRAEILDRLDAQHRVILTSVAALAGLSLLLPEILDDERHYLLLLASGVYTVLGIHYVEQDRMIAGLGRYINIGLSDEIKALGFEKALKWEEFRSNETSLIGSLSLAMSIFRYLPTIGAAAMALGAFFVLEGKPANWELGEVALLVLDFLGLGLALVGAVVSHHEYRLINTRRPNNT